MRKILRIFNVILDLPAAADVAVVLEFEKRLN